MSRRRTALLLVSDKTGIVELASGLKELGFDLLSGGSTLRTLRQAEIDVDEVSLAPFDPDLLPRILLDPEDPASRAALRERDAEPIDLVAVNLYPMAEILSAPHVTQKEALELVDAAPSALLRAAARNFERAIPLCDPADYGRVVETLTQLKDLSRSERQALAAKTFFYTAYYDSTVAQYLAVKPEFLPEELVMGLKKQRDLAYGENPHQKAALYGLSGARPWGLAASRQLQGKDLHFNHFLSLDLALEVVGEFSEPACALVKHALPCGAATEERPAEALRLAAKSDPLAVPGAVAALNREVDEETARVLSELGLEAVVAPEFSQPALAILRLRKDLRLATVPSTLLSPRELYLYPVSGGLLLEEKDNQTHKDLKMVSQRPPSQAELAALVFAWKLAKHAKTYAAVLAQGTRTLGVGSGQPSRLDALRLAIRKSNERHPILDPRNPLVLASDGTLPLRCIHEAAEIGVSAVIQPGATSDDEALVKLCDQEGLALVFTGLRHFKH